MSKLKLKVSRAKHLNLQTRTMGYVARVTTNGKAFFDEIAADASENTTMHRAELRLALELCMDSVAKMLRQGYIVDLGPVGKLYPSCTSPCVDNVDDLLLSDVRPSLYYRASNEVATAIRTARLQWTKKSGSEPDELDV